MLLWILKKELSDAALGRMENVSNIKFVIIYMTFLNRKINEISASNRCLLELPYKTGGNKLKWILKYYDATSLIYDH